MTKIAPSRAFILRRGLGTKALGYGYEASAKYARSLDERSCRHQQEAAAMLARLIERWPVEVRRECLSLPIDEDPIFAVIRAARGDGVSLSEIGNAYGVTRELMRQIEARGLYRMSATRDYAQAWRDRVDEINGCRSDWRDIQEAMEA